MIEWETDDPSAGEEPAAPPLPRPLVDYVLFDPADGRVIAAGKSPEFALAELAPPGVSVLRAACPDPNSYRVDLQTLTLTAESPAATEYYEWEWDQATAKYVRVPTLAGAKRMRWAQVVDKRDLVIEAGITLGGRKWDTDASARSAVLEVVQAVSSGWSLPADFEWPDADGALVAMTQTQFRALARAMMEHSKAAFRRAAELRAAIKAAPDKATVAAVDISQGWPV